MSSGHQDKTIAALAELGRINQLGDERMHVKVCSPFKVYFDEEAVSISAENATGPFDILPMHHNFITLLEPCEILVVRPGIQGKQRIKISGGLMHVKSNDVKVFLDV